MDARGYDAVAPRPEPGLKERPLLDLAAGYVQRSIDSFPRQGDRSPWRVRQNYVIDSATTMRTNLSKTLMPVESPTRVHAGTNAVDPVPASS